MDPIVTARDELEFPAPVFLLLAATAAFSLAAVIDNPLWSVVSSAAGTIAAGASIFVRRPLRFSPVSFAGMLAFLVTVGAATQIMGRFSILSGSYGVDLLLALSAACLGIVSFTWPTRNLTMIVALATVVFGTLTILIPNWLPVLSTDVYRAHTSAGRAIAEGANPYSDAVVFESGDPNKPEGTLVEGYPYPVPPLATYGVAAIFTDPRIVSALAWLLFAGMLAWFARKPQPGGDVALAALLLVGTAPIWRMALFVGWTEPISVVLIALSLVGIRAQKKWAWILLGVGLASKQYLVFLAPIALMYRDKAGRRPGWTAVITAAILAALPAAFGIREYYTSVVGNALGIGFRPDSQSIDGMVGVLGGTFVIPTLMAVLIVIGLTIVVGKLDHSPSDLGPAGVVVLAVTFLFTSAFPNYWMFLVGLSTMAAILTDSASKGGLGADASDPGQHISSAAKSTPNH